LNFYETARYRYQVEALLWLISALAVAGSLGRRWSLAGARNAASRSEPSSQALEGREHAP
jgi:hypothetical protein